jgi:hypothetical protein
LQLFYFHVRNHVDAVDHEGTSLANLEAARREALKDIADIMREKWDAIGMQWSAWSIEICDDNRKILLIVPFTSN